MSAREDLAPEHGTDEQGTDEPRTEETRREEPSAEEDRARPAARRPRWRRRLERWRALPWRRRLLSENLRLALSWLLSFAVGPASVLLLDGAVPEDGTAGLQLPLTLMIVIVMISVYALAYAALTLYALAGQPRSRMVAAARLPRARRHVSFYRWYVGRTSAFHEVLQMLLIAVLAVGLLIMPPPWVPVPALLALTVAAVITAWISAVATFAVEYAAEDSRGRAFALPNTEGAERTLHDYLYGALLIQTTSGTSDMVPLTPAARRIVRHHVVLAYLMSTIIITLGVSAVITAVA
jgi:uncharacterized membrane protein